MATRNSIGRLTARIEELVRRQLPPLTLSDLSDAAWAKLDARLSEMSGQGLVPRRDACARMTDDALIRGLLALGTLVPADLRRPQ